MKKILATSLIIISFLTPGVCSAQSELDVVFEQTPLFSDTDIFPGDTITRWVEVTNNTAETKPIATEAINFPGFPDPGSVPGNDLSRALDFVIRVQGGADLYGGSAGAETLFDFYQDGETYLSDLGSGASQTYEFEISFPSEKSNQWQGKTTGFDILVGFQGEEGSSDNTEGSSGGGGGSPLRGLTITNESDTVLDEETCTIQVTWFTNYFSSSEVIYSPEGGNHTLDLGEANYGYDNSEEGDDSGIEKVTNHSVTLTGLTPGTKYYYRCVSHGSLSVGQERSFETDCCCEPEEENSPSEEGFSGGEGIVFNPPVSGGGNQIEAGGEQEEEEEKEEEKTEAPETVSEQEEEKNGSDIASFSENSTEGDTGALNAFLANIGEFVSGLFSGDTCLPCFLILIIFAYSLYRTKNAKNKDAKKIWGGWSIILLGLAIFIRTNVGFCIPGWVLILLILITYLIHRFTLYSTDQIAG